MSGRLSHAKPGSPRARQRPVTSAEVTGRWSEPQEATHSHSMVPGGLLVTSRTTRLTSGTSFVMRVEIFARTS